MTQIQTVRGPIDAARLGVTLMHGDIFVLTTEPQGRKRERGKRGIQDAESAEKDNKLFREFRVLNSALSAFSLITN